MSLIDNTRQVVLDTETTGMNKQGAHYLGHRIIEIGAVEMINRQLTGQQYHAYINPERLVDAQAVAVHGINNTALDDKPKFAEIVDEFIDFVRGAELVIHNAPFDVGFINYELSMSTAPERKITDLCQITDTLALAKQLFPRKRNNLNALSERYGVDVAHRTLHGALLDAEILAEVYLLMTSGQTDFDLNDNAFANQLTQKDKSTSFASLGKLAVISATEQELKAHQHQLGLMKEQSGNCLWDNR